MKKMIVTQRYVSPCGEMILGAYDGELCLCDWVNSKRRTNVDNRLQRLLKARFEVGSTMVIEEACRQLDGYFRGVRRKFDLPLYMGGTDFQIAVWSELRRIPYGKTIEYGELAKRLGMPKSVRAVANTVGMNGLSVMVPCHRVLGIHNQLIGYNGGLEAKEYLLNLEHGVKYDV